MLQLKNRTPFAAMPMLFPNAAGIDTMFAVVKGTFAIGDRLALADEQLPITLQDQHYGDPTKTSIRMPSDVSLEKLGTDVVVIGSACARDERPTWQMDVSLSVGAATKTVRVCADRVWGNVPGAAPTWVAPFVTMPLVWERAFGGHDASSEPAAADPRNPVGVGFRGRNSARPIAGMPLPNIEDPAAPISSPTQAPPPAGLGPVAPHWQPRQSYAGTYDNEWMENRAPYLPRDFDARFCQIAPPGLVAQGHLRGGELVQLMGVTPNGAIQFQLPTHRVEVTYVLDGGEQSRPALLDTVIIEVDARRAILVWRAALPCDKKALKVKEIRPSIVPAA